MLDLSKFERIGLSVVPLSNPDGLVCLCYKPQYHFEEIQTVFGAVFYTEEKLADIINETEISTSSVPCPRCGHREVLVSDGGNTACLMCGYFDC